MTLRKTPLYDSHVSLGGQMVEFAGYAMPVRYQSEKLEHMHVRNEVGLFDVSHMGEVFISGPKAINAADIIFPADIAGLSIGKAVYCPMLNERGTIIDDVIVYRLEEEKLLVCVNASNQLKDFKWIKQQVAATYGPHEASVENESDSYSQIAIQGPRAIELCRLALGNFVSGIASFHFAQETIEIDSQRFPIIAARTGYTGEDGLEIFVKNEHAVALWTALLQPQQALVPMACGLSARDTLRLEAGLCLYGNDISETTTALEAGLSWTIAWKKQAEFIGKQALLKQKEEGVGKRLRGLVLKDRGIARPGYDIEDSEGKTIGKVCSGTITPYLNKAVAMAYIDRPHFSFGNTVNVLVRNRKLMAEVVKLPFRKRSTLCQTKSQKTGFTQENTSGLS